MKKVLSNNITSTARQPVTKVTLAHYTEALSEVAQALAKGLTADTATPTILYGCVNSASPNANITAGAVYYNGEVYLCDAFIDGTITNAIVGTITTVYDGADPVLFSDGSSHNVHQINKIVWSDAVSGTGTFDFSNCVVINKWSEYIVLDADMSANSGTFYNGATGSRRLRYFKVGKSVTVDIKIDGANTSVGSIAELKINLPAIIGTTSQVFTSVGRFINTDAPTFNTPPDKGTTAMIITIEADDKIHMKPLIGSIDNFYTSGSDNIQLTGQITFEVD